MTYRFLFHAALAGLFLLGGPSAQAAEKLTFATDWKAQAEQGGFYQAQARGFYAARGLDVKIRQGGPAVNIPQLMAAGAIDLGMGSSSFIALNMVREGVPVRAVMASFQKDPQVLMTHPDPSVKSLADLKGRPVLVSDATIGTFWKWLEYRLGYQSGQIRKYTYNLAPFLNDARAVQQGYVTSEPYLIETQGGFKPQTFLLADEGYPAYACLVLAPQALIDTKPEIVQAFVDATIDGWADYLWGDPSPGDKLIQADNPQSTPALLAQARERMKAEGIVSSGDTATSGIGAMSDKRWREFRDVMAATHVYAADIDVTRAYTLAFVNKGRGIQPNPKSNP
jgi:NitT/TauT family transport system substrate-binding protein